MSGVFVNVGGTWKDATNYFVNVNGTWKEGNEINARMGTDWKDSGIIKDNLTIHYDGYNTNSYSGTQTTIGGVAYDWLDLSGNANHGQVDPNVNSNRITFDTTEKAFEFANVTGAAGVDDNISISNLNYVSGASDAITNLTIACWCKSNSGTLDRGAHDQRIIASFDRSAVWRFGIGCDGSVGSSTGSSYSAGKLVFGFMGANSGGGQALRGDFVGGGGESNHNSTSHTYDLRDNSWHYVAVTFTTSELRWYVDGVKIDTMTFADNHFTTQADDGAFGKLGGGTTGETPRFGFIGTGSEAGSFSGTAGPRHLFAGKIGAFHYYTSGSNSAATLTDAQILHNFNALKYRYGFT